MNRILISIFLILIILFPGLVFAHQVTIKEGRQELDSKEVRFGKTTSCKVVPEMEYDLDEPGTIKVYFTTEWLRRGQADHKSQNKLFLFDDYNRYSNWFEENGLRLEYSAAATDAKSSDFKCMTFYNLEEISHEPFANGYMILDESSGNLIKIEGIKNPKAVVEIKFRFLYIVPEGKRRVIKDIADEEIYWTFYLPQSNGEEMDCVALKEEYASQILEVTSTLENYDKVIDLKNEIEQNPSFDLCPDLKTTLIQELDTLLQQGESFTIIEKSGPDKSNKLKTESTPTPARFLQAEWNRIEKKYDKELSNLTKDYNLLKNQTRPQINALSQAVEDNRGNIQSLDIILIDTAIISRDSLGLLEDKFDSLKFFNNLNKESADIISDKLHDFRTELRKQMWGCESKFVKIEKGEGKKRSGNYISRYEKLINRVEEIEDLVDVIQQKIQENDGKLQDMLRFFDKEKNIVFKEIKSRYDSLFLIYSHGISNEEEKFSTLKEKFEEIRYSKWFFNYHKNNFSRRIDDIYDRSLELQFEDSLLKLEKDTELALLDLSADFDNEKNFEKVLDDFLPEMVGLQARIREWPTRAFPFFYLILFILVFSILIFGARVYFKALQAKKVGAKTLHSIIPTNGELDKPKSGGITITKTESNTEKGKGLARVRKQAGIEYIELDMNREWTDTVVHKVYFSRNCIIKAYRFFEDSIHAVDTNTTANETGGYLIGQWDFNPEDGDKIDVSLEDFIEPGDDATFSRYQLNFGSKIGVKLQKTLDNCRQKENTDFVMTAWFHSHPGLKIFLSDFDLTVQQDFSGMDDKLRMIALVIDPYTQNWDTGIFTYKRDGSMNNAEDSKQFFSMEDLYKWARGSFEGAPDNFFSVPIKKYAPDTSVNNIYFSNPNILEIKRCIEDSASKGDKIIAFLTGEKMLDGHGNFDLVFRKLESNEGAGETEKDEKSRFLGCLVSSVDLLSGDSGILSNKDLLNNKIPLILAYNWEDKTITLAIRRKDGKYRILSNENRKIKLAKMIAWTRKRK